MEKQNQTFSLLLSPNVVNQINTMCNLIHDKEWSGVIFYTNNNFNLTDFEVKAERILLLDIGTTTATNFDFEDPRITDFLMDNPEYFSYNMGVIHSHNNMNVFYSGADNADIGLMSKEFVHYLSIVVNNKLDIIGTITYKSEYELTGILKTTIPSYDNTNVVIEEEVTRTGIKYNRLDAVIGYTELTFSDEVLNFIKEKQEKQQQHQNKTAAELPLFQSEFPKVEQSYNKINTYDEGYSPTYPLKELKEINTRVRKEAKEIINKLIGDSDDNSELNLDEAEEYWESLNLDDKEFISMIYSRLGELLNEYSENDNEMYDELIVEIQQQLAELDTQHKHINLIKEIL